ncbi:MAG: hypothetical protein II189_00320, partial [Lachnospiraceae bacterium]|nr:hypothetical protein [Lachnospiraceae bacterium]
MIAMGRNLCIKLTKLTQKRALLNPPALLFYLHDCEKQGPWRKGSLLKKLPQVFDHGREKAEAFRKAGALFGA